MMRGRCIIQKINFTTSQTNVISNGVRNLPLPSFKLLGFPKAEGFLGCGLGMTDNSVIPSGTRDLPVTQQGDSSATASE